jgi:hypothetical protein
LAYSSLAEWLSIYPEERLSCGAKKDGESMAGKRNVTMFGMAGALAVAATAALAAASATDGIRLANDIVPAPFGYETVTAKYVVAEATPLYVSPYIYPGTVNNTKLRAGQAVDVLAKAKGYDWILVGRNGIGVGYIPVSRLAPANTAAR